MESLNYAFEGRGFLFNDSGLELPVDSFTRSRSLLKELNLNPFSDHEGEELFMESSSALSPFDPFLPAKRTVPENDPKEVTIIQSSKKRSDLSSAKRPRVTNFSPQQVLFCQVHGCNRDLSSSKDYHKRHKVCDEHSKTAKVIVNGIEQRFCQQCSRFHLLAEFDDDKRSCRKRLAGHNERRRKPHRDSQWDIVGSRFIDLRVEKTVSFLFPEITTHSNFCHESYEQEGRQVCSSRRTLPRPKPHLEETFQVQDFCGGENSISSHSLLSPHSDPKGDLGVENYPSLGMSSTSTNFTLSELDGFGVAVEGEGVLEVHDGNIGLNYEAEVDMNLQRADCMNLSCHFYPENGETIDLQQLSMHLLRVEQQRSYDQVKHDSSNFCFTTT